MSKHQIIYKDIGLQSTIVLYLETIAESENYKVWSIVIDINNSEKKHNRPRCNIVLRIYKKNTKCWLTFDPISIRCNTVLWCFYLPMLDYNLDRAILGVAGEDAAEISQSVESCAECSLGDARAITWSRRENSSKLSLTSPTTTSLSEERRINQNLHSDHTRDVKRREKKGVLQRKEEAPS